MRFFKQYSCVNNCCFYYWKPKINKCEKFYNLIAKLVAKFEIFFNQFSNKMKTWLRIRNIHSTEGAYEKWLSGFLPQIQHGFHGRYVFQNIVHIYFEIKRVFHLMLFCCFADIIVRRRLLIDGEGSGDNRKIQTLLKTFLKWFHFEGNEDER